MKRRVVGRKRAAGKKSPGRQAGDEPADGSLQAAIGALHAKFGNRAVARLLRDGNGPASQVSARIRREVSDEDKKVLAEPQAAAKQDAEPSGGIGALVAEARKRMLLEQAAGIGSGVGGLVGGAAEQVAGGGAAVSAGREAGAEQRDGLGGITKLLGEAQKRMLLEQAKAMLTGVGGLVGGAVQQVGGAAAAVAAGPEAGADQKDGLGGITKLLGEAQKRMLLEQAKAMLTGVGGLVGGAVEQLAGVGSLLGGGAAAGSHEAAGEQGAMTAGAKMVQLWDGIQSNLDGAISALDEKPPAAVEAVRLLQQARTAGDKLGTLTDALPAGQASGEVLYAVFGATGTLDSALISLEPHVGILQPLTDIGTALEAETASMKALSSQFPELQKAAVAPEAKEAGSGDKAGGREPTAEQKLMDLSPGAYRPWRYMGGGTFFEYLSERKAATEAAPVAPKSTPADHWCTAVDFVERAAQMLKQGMLAPVALMMLQQAGAEIEKAQDLVEGGSLVWGKLGGTAGAIAKRALALEPQASAPRPIGEVSAELRRILADMKKNTSKIAALA